MVKSLKFAPFELRPQQKILLRGEEIVILAPKTLAILTVLVEEAGNVVPPSELVQRI